MKIAIDLGGTSVRACRIDRDGLVGKVLRRPCPAQGTQQEVTDSIYGLVDELFDKDVSSIGVAVPAIVDTQRGIVYNVCNIPSWKEVHLKEEMERRYGVPTFVDNDVNCFTLGLQHDGEGAAFRSFVGIAMGTGLGMGIVVNGRLYRGSNTCAGEVGSIPYLESDFEHYTSSLFLRSRTSDSGVVLTEKAAHGDAEALEIFGEMGRHLGNLLQVVVYTYDPEAVIIGGGLAHAANYFDRSMKLSLSEGFPYPHVLHRLHIIYTRLDDANLYGTQYL